MHAPQEELLLAAFTLQEALIGLLYFALHRVDRRCYGCFDAVYHALNLQTGRHAARNFEV